jgi:hypothetical protein
MSTSLTIYLGLVFTLSCLSFLCALFRLSSSEYPRKSYTLVSMGQDVVTVIILVLLGAWQAYLLFGGAAAK